MTPLRVWGVLGSATIFVIKSASFMYTNLRGSMSPSDSERGHASFPYSSRGRNTHLKSDIRRACPACVLVLLFFLFHPFCLGHFVSRLYKSTKHAPPPFIGIGGSISLYIVLIVSFLIFLFHYYMFIFRKISCPGEYFFIFIYFPSAPFSTICIARAHWFRKFFYTLSAKNVKSL